MEKQGIIGRKCVKSAVELIGESIEYLSSFKENEDAFNDEYSDFINYNKNKLISIYYSLKND